MKLAHLAVALACCLSPPLSAQVRINEIVTSNSIYLDEDGDSPDWFELRNFGAEAVDLTGYYLSDKPDQPQKWRIVDLSLGPDEYAFVWASGKDRATVNVHRTLIDRGDAFRYLIPQAPVDPAWTGLGFDDGDWAVGPTGIGYGDGDDETTVPDGTLSVFARRTFTITSPERVEAMFLDIDYDDGFVAYLNGQRIARANMTGNPPAWDALANSFVEPRIVNEAPPGRYIVANVADLLLPGENVLAIQVHNFNATSSDLTLIPFLTARFTGIGTEGSIPPAILGYATGSLHTNFRLTAEGEAVYLHDAAGDFVDSLRAYGLPADVSIGIPGNGGAPAFFSNTTPGERNPDAGFDGVVTDELTFSNQGGLFSDPLRVTLRGATGENVIRYTLDATEPTPESTVYTGPLDISATTVVRAAIFREGYLPGRVKTANYLFDVGHQLPVVTLVTEPDNFFHPLTGAYVLGSDYTGTDVPFFGSNIWEDIEHPINFSFYEPDGSDAFHLDGGVKIFGGWSRAFDQRSLSLFARGRYGETKMKYDFFPRRDYDKFQALVLRNSGNDNQNSSMRDVVLTGLMENSEVDIQAHRTVVTYLNGEYWGVYHLREKINEHFLASLHDVDPDGIDLVEQNGQPIHGSAEAYNAMVDYARDNPVDEAVHYDYLAGLIDLDNYAQYQGAQIYFDNKDWPGNNIKFWKARGGKWRWIQFDTDFGGGPWSDNAANVNTLNFALEPNGPNWPNPPWSTLLFRRLITNENFRNLFVNRLADDMNSRFLPEVALARINARADLIRAEIPRQNARWGRAGNWGDNVERMRKFFRERPARMKGFVRREFSLPAVHRLDIRISDTDEGYVEVNSLTIEEAQWSGDYFQDVPIRVKAVAREGYSFVRWELDNTSAEEELTINMTDRRRLRPVFREEATSVPELRNSLAAVSGVDLSPNPSAGEMLLRFSVQHPVTLTAEVFDSQGRIVRQLFSERFGAGTRVQRKFFNDVAPGVYLVRLTERGGGTATVKWVRR